MYFRTTYYVLLLVQYRYPRYSEIQGSYDTIWPWTQWCHHDIVKFIFNKIRPSSRFSRKTSTIFRSCDRGHSRPNWSFYLVSIRNNYHRNVSHNDSDSKLTTLFGEKFGCGIKDFFIKFHKSAYFFLYFQKKSNSKTPEKNKTFSSNLSKKFSMEIK